MKTTDGLFLECDCNTYNDVCSCVSMYIGAMYVHVLATVDIQQSFNSENTLRISTPVREVWHTSSLLLE